MDVLLQVWQTAVRVSKGPEHLTYMEKVRYLGLFSLEKRRLSWKPAAALNCMVRLMDRMKPDLSQSCKR